jgi:hypothetical protein
MTARIFRPAPSATQSGPGAQKPWALAFEPESARGIDPLMGWTSSSDMKAQIKLRFATREEAVGYATRNGFAYTVEEPKPETASRRVLSSYSDNFKPTRIGQWTH